MAPVNSIWPNRWNIAISRKAWIAAFLMTLPIPVSYAGEQLEESLCRSLSQQNEHTEYPYSHAIDQWLNNEHLEKAHVGFICQHDQEILFSLTNLPAIGQGTYSGTIKSGNIVNVSRISPYTQLIRVVVDKSRNSFLLAQTMTAKGGIMQTDIGLMSLTTPTESTPLLSTQQDAVEGFCGSGTRWQSLGLQKASNTSAFTYKDINDDGIEDVEFVLSEMACPDREHHNIKYQLLAQDVGFKMSKEEK